MEGIQEEMMTDFDLTKACADAMGLDVWLNRMGVPDSMFSCWQLPYDVNGYSARYDPLTDDAQAMALIKRFGLWIAYGRRSEENGLSACMWRVGQKASGPYEWHDDLNRAVVLCVAENAAQLAHLSAHQEMR